MSMRDRSVLVTGAGGFIGSHLVERLLAQGARVRAFVRYTSRGDRGFLDQVPDEYVAKLQVVSGDLGDASAIHHAMRDMEVVLHLAALIAIPYSYVHPRDVVQTNVIGTLNVLEAARDLRPACVVHTSTSEVYGTALRVPINEAHPLQGQSPYSASKIGADMLAQSYHRAFDLPIVTLRPFNTYGPRQSTRAVVPTIITQALRGSVVRLGSTTPTRDFTFVDDTVAGFLAVVAAGASVFGETIHLGTGSEVSIGELAQRIIALTGGEARIETDNARLRPSKSEVERLLSENSRARKLLGWQPTVTLDEGLQRTIDWIAANSQLFPDGYHV